MGDKVTPEVERSIKELCASGLSYREVAEMLGYCVPTVKHYAEDTSGHFKAYMKRNEYKYRGNKYDPCPRCGERKARSARLCRKCHFEAKAGGHRSR